MKLIGKQRKRIKTNVALLVSAWIETRELGLLDRRVFVALLVSAWIETFLVITPEVFVASHSS